MLISPESWTALQGGMYRYRAVQGGFVWYLSMYHCSTVPHQVCTEYVLQRRQSRRTVTSMLRCSLGMQLADPCTEYVLSMYSVCTSMYWGCTWYVLVLGTYLYPGHSQGHSCNEYVLRTYFACTSLYLVCTYLYSYVLGMYILGCDVCKMLSLQSAKEFLPLH